ncbi:MAG: TIGR01906 family membrane protein [Chloroflexi bacterium]|nr:TIGR01906 family membrane protein [Chloroflexota bacterium]
MALAVFLITSNVRLAFNSLSLYEFGFARHRVSETTGLTRQQLSDVGRQIRDYFNSSEVLLDVGIPVDGGTQPLFNQREVLHMRDVKELVREVYRVQEGAFLTLFLFATAGFFILGNWFPTQLRRLLVQGSVLTVTVVGLVAMVSVVAFGPLFRLFHQLGFANDLWQLDPATSYLVRLFPFGFWLESTLLIGLASVVESVAILLLLLLIRWWRDWRQRIAQRKAPQFI